MRANPACSCATCSTTRRNRSRWPLRLARTGSLRVRPMRRRPSPKRLDPIRIALCRDLTSRGSSLLGRHRHRSPSVPPLGPFQASSRTNRAPWSLPSPHTPRLRALMPLRDCHSCDLSCGIVRARRRSRPTPTRRSHPLLLCPPRSARIPTATSRRSALAPSTSPSSPTSARRTAPGRPLRPPLSLPSPACPHMARRGSGRPSAVSRRRRTDRSVRHPTGRPIEHRLCSPSSFCLSRITLLVGLLAPVRIPVVV